MILMRSSEPSISFGIIIPESEPCSRHFLRTIDTFAHDIMVAEGACPVAGAAAQGHSTEQI